MTSDQDLCRTVAESAESLRKEMGKPKRSPSGLPRWTEAQLKAQREWLPEELGELWQRRQDDFEVEVFLNRAVAGDFLSA